MKIGNPQTPSQPASTQQTRDSAHTRPESDRRDEEKSSRFGSALEKKASEKDKAKGTSGATDGAPSSLAGALPFPQQHLAAPIETGSAAPAGRVAPPEIAALSGEIQHCLEVTGPNEVRIQFDAKVLDGLSVTLTRESGALQVSLQASSPEMARFLEVHAASLAQALERPERAAFITVETRPHAGDQHGGGQGRRQQDRQEQEQSSGDER